MIGGTVPTLFDTVVVVLESFVVVLHVGIDLVDLGVRNLRILLSSEGICNSLLDKAEAMVVVPMAGLFGIARSLIHVPVSSGLCDILDDWFYVERRGDCAYRCNS